MAIKMSDRTHVVTFFDGGRKYFAEPSRQYSLHDRVPIGVSEPTISCAMPKKAAIDLANFLRKESSFQKIVVNALKVKAQ